MRIQRRRRHRHRLPPALASHEAFLQPRPTVRTPTRRPASDSRAPKKKRYEAYLCASFLYEGSDIAVVDAVVASSTHPRSLAGRESPKYPQTKHPTVLLLLDESDSCQSTWSSCTPAAERGFHASARPKTSGAQYHVRGSWTPCVVPPYPIPLPRGTATIGPLGPHTTPSLISSRG